MHEKLGCSDYQANTLNTSIEGLCQHLRLRKSRNHCPQMLPGKQVAIPNIVATSTVPLLKPSE